MIDNNDFKNGQLSSDNYQFTKYKLIATPTYQKQNLANAYFDTTIDEKDKDKIKQKIAFSWDTNIVGIENFYQTMSMIKNLFIQMNHII